MTRSGEKISTDEIEITPEMIEAGVRAYIESDEYFEGRDEIVGRIFRKMREAQAVGSSKRNAQIGHGNI